MASGTHVKRSGGGGRGLIVIIFIALVLAAAYLVSSMFFIFVGGSFVSRNESRVDLSFSGIEKTGTLLRLKAPAEIDLRGNDIDAGDYKSLAAAFPDCVIRWDVPLGGVGETWDNFSESVKVPVLANGDIRTWADAQAVLNETGCSGVIIGRGACGNPWAFKHILQQKDEEISTREKVEGAVRHLEMLVEWMGESWGVIEARKHIAWYLHGVRGAAAVRARIMTMKEKREVIGDLRSIG